MSNNSNPYSLDGEQVRSKGLDNNVVRATVLDVLPDAHSVRVNPRGDNAPVVTPVITPMYGSHMLPSEGERVMLLYVAENTPICLGSIYLLDGEAPPDAKNGDIIVGNNTGSQIEITADGSIRIETGHFQPVNIRHQSATVRMSTDQTIAGDDTYDVVQFDTAQDDPENLFDPANNSLTVRHDGQHRVEATVEITSAGQNNEYALALLNNGTIVKRIFEQSVQNAPLSISVATQQHLDAGSELTIQLRQDSGSDKIINSDNLATEFSIERHGI